MTPLSSYLFFLNYESMFDVYENGLIVELAACLGCHPAFGIRQHGWDPANPTMWECKRKRVEDDDGRLLLKQDWATELRTGSA